MRWAQSGVGYDGAGYVIEATTLRLMAWPDPDGGWVAILRVRETLEEQRTYHKTARAAKREAIRKALRWLDAQRAPLAMLLGKEGR